MTRNFTNSIYLLAIFVFLCAAYFSSGFHHFDEHFQILEFLNLKLGGTTAKELPWEYENQMRSWLQPFTYYALTKFLAFFNLSDPFSLSFIFRLFGGLLGVSALVLLTSKEHQSFLNITFTQKSLLLILFSWFLPYILVRTSGEALGTTLFIWGYFFCVKSFENEESKAFHVGLVSLFWGLAFLARFSIGVMVFFAILWIFYKRKWPYQYYLFFFFGLLCVFSLGFAVDYWGYEQQTFSPWNYFYQNLVLGKSSRFGVTPWWDYFRLIINRGIPPLSLIYLLGSFYFFYRYPGSLLTWITLPFFIIHSLIGHKELRFLFPCIPFAVLQLAIIITEYESHIKKRFWKKIFYAFLSMNFILLLYVSFSPANIASNFYSFMHKEMNHIEKLYVIGEDPYKMLGLNIHFYNEKKPTIQLIQKLEEIPDQNTWVFINKRGGVVPFLESKACDLQYLSYPWWSLHFNIGNWVNRSRVWALFRCQKNRS